MPSREEKDSRTSDVDCKIRWRVQKGGFFLFLLVDLGFGEEATCVKLVQPKYVCSVET